MDAKCQILSLESDIGGTMTPLSAQLKSDLADDKSTLLSSRNYVHLADRAAVDKSLSRLVRENRIYRIKPGVFAKANKTRFGAVPPAFDEIATELERFGGEIWVSNPALDANLLGLTEQVPVTEIFLTSGQARTLQLGKRTVTLRAAKKWQLIGGLGPRGRAIRALGWATPENVVPAAVEISRRLSKTDWQFLVDVRPALPSWIARAISIANADK
jgi:hypothetical protein